MSTRTPFDWSATPASWSELGQRVLFEFYTLAAEKRDDQGDAVATTGEISRALDRAMRAISPLPTVSAWVADKCADIPVEVNR